MDISTSQTYLFDAASPNVSAVASEALPEDVATTEELKLLGPGSQAMRRQQWEALKPVVEKIYIQENKPFTYLADVLRKEHGFEPT